VIASSRAAAVRHRHAGARFAYGQGPHALGATSLTVLRRTGKETFATLVYWFDARGTLTALETFAGGCLEHGGNPGFLRVPPRWSRSRPAGGYAGYRPR